jgi:AraC-like DNA-binding protein
MSVFFTAESYTDFDAYVEAIKTWELEFMQIGPGRFRADILMFGDSDLSTPKTISELCKITEVDERTLRNVFYEQFSVSPKKFINSYRLNKVKNALNRFESSDFNVSDIANAYGFWHMGQFARDYHRLFGELPSETQKK